MIPDREFAHHQDPARTMGEGVIPEMRDLPKSETSWEELNSPGSSKYSRPQEFWREGPMDIPPPVNMEELMPAEEPMMIEAPMPMAGLMPRVGSMPMPMPMPGLTGVPPPWVFRSRFKPRDDALPWLEAMDDDRDGNVSASEYAWYVQMLRKRATSAIERGSSSQGTALLKAIADFHYDSLQDCFVRFSKVWRRPPWLAESLDWCLN